MSTDVSDYQPCMGRDITGARRFGGLNHLKATWYLFSNPGGMHG